MRANAGREGGDVVPSPTQIPQGMWPVRPACSVLLQLCGEGVGRSGALRGWGSQFSMGLPLQRTPPGQGSWSSEPSPRAGRPQAEVGSTQRYSFFLLW